MESPGDDVASADRAEHGKGNDGERGPETDEASARHDGDKSLRSSEEAGVKFKKPTPLIGPRRGGGSPARAIGKACDSTPADTSVGKESAAQDRSNDPAFTYVEPPWCGKPREQYTLEVLKSGTIVDAISLNERSSHVIGRLPTCDLSLAHPTISRYHAVLLYRSADDDDDGGGGNSKGLYVYDLGSTHGTFWNGSRIRPNVYVRVRGGHMLKFGCSQRRYILQAPPEDQEEESEHSVTESKRIRELELESRRTDSERKKLAEEKESEGIDWGMGEDADEATDLEENPYASTVDEDLILDDPKKTLRGWFEREGYDLQYRTEEKGIGQFLCWVELPLECSTGRSVRAEALVKGKKKEAVVQCALEACKILDKYGVLRQANHESRKRKSRNWEEQDYYDSDEDNFLDRTGSVEKKREQRMRLAGKLDEKVETYESLLKKHEAVTKQISDLSDTIKKSQTTRREMEEAGEEDALDAFMSTLNSAALSKGDVSKMKLELQNLRKEEAGLLKLLNLTRPADLPALSVKTASETTEKDLLGSVKPKKFAGSASSNSKSRSAVRCGKRREANRWSEDASTDGLRNDDDVVGEVCESEHESDEESGNEMGAAVSSKGSSTDRHGDPEEAEECEARESIRETDRRSLAIDKPSNTSATVMGSTKEIKRREVKRPKKHEQFKQSSCDQDMYAENYSTWVPPQNQHGDGKTSLNEKYGY